MLSLRLPYQTLSPEAYRASALANSLSTKVRSAREKVRDWRLAG
jgi:hypothetical protein